MDASVGGVVSLSSRVAIDIGSTVIKVARIKNGDELIDQSFHSRDFEAGIANQVESLLNRSEYRCDSDDLLICSSAHGGLRVGIICLTEHFSGAVLRNQVLSAGANPIFVRTLDEVGGNLIAVDILLVGGGIDCQDAAPLAERLQRFDSKGYHFGSLVYAGNSTLAGRFLERFPQANVVANPLSDTLIGHTDGVCESIRRAYLDDLVYKEGVSELGSRLSSGILPTPEVVSRGFERAVFNHSSVETASPCILLDIGGATTDLHYTVEIVRDDSDNRAAAGVSVARYVFTDLGIVASRDSTLLQMRSHPQIYEFLDTILQEDVREVYQLLREGEYCPTPGLLSYACLFLSLDRFAMGRGPGLPTADLGKVAQILLSGGAAQVFEETLVARIVDLFVPEKSGKPLIFIDRRYQIWVDGITWSG